MNLAADLIDRGALALAVTHEALSQAKRVWVCDPAGKVPLRRQGVLEEVTRVGPHVVSCHVWFDAEMRGIFPPEWLHDVAAVERDNVVAFPGLRR